MAYGLKYTTQFDSQDDANNASKRYTLNFLYKDYPGAVISIPGGETTVVQKCTVDDPLAAIKGQSLEIGLLNVNGSLPITSFYAPSDDGIQVQLLDELLNPLFIGFLVQDDCYEQKVDFTHQITLSANDSLGLLKGVILSESVLRRGYLTSFQTNGVNTVVYVSTQDTAFYPEAGNTIEFLGVSYIIASAVKEITFIGIGVFHWTITLTTSTGGIAITVGNVYLTGTVNLLNRNSLLTIIAVCLASTNLNLVTNIYHNVFEIRHDMTRSSFEQTILDTQLFINGETYDNCYDVLTKIMTTFRCSLFQANGQWNIVHWDELRNYPVGALPGYQYDETWIYLGQLLLNNNFFIGREPQLTRPLYPLTEGIFRPYKFVRKQFDYVFPKYLLKNYDLLKVGALLRDYTVSAGTIRYREYIATDWTAYGTPLYVDRFIRVITVVATGTEIGRLLILKGDPGGLSFSKSVQAVPIEVNVGDRLKFSCAVRTTTHFTGTWSLQFAVMLTDGPNAFYVDDLPVGAGAWIPTIGFQFNGGGADTFAWNNVEIESSPIPFSGLLYCYLTEFNSSGQETQYRDIRFEYIPTIADSTKVIGHIHKQQQDVDIKNNTDVKIEIDDSERNPIAGTLFLPTMTGLLQTRTSIWVYKSNTAEGFKLGELICLEELRWREQLRSRLEGGFIGLFQNQIISLLTVAITTFDPNKNYTFGLLSIDYKRNQFSGTLWEVWDSGEPALVNVYTFTYIYSTT